MKIRKQNKFKNRDLKLVSWFEFFKYFKPEVEFYKHRDSGYHVASTTKSWGMVEDGRTKRKAYNRLFKFFKLVLRGELKTMIVTDNGKLFKVKSGENTINGLAKIAMADIVCQCSDQRIA